MDYDVIVVGGGHAGMEAALAAAHLNMSTLLVTLNKNMLANMPCNPSIGGSAKGIVVREIDALGGVMGIIADKACLQMKMLNTGKGPGVQCLRAQEDKLDYPKLMLEYALNTKNLTILEGMVDDLLHDDNHVYGVKIQDKEYTSKAVILTTGTYMESTILRGHKVTVAGPDGENPSLGLSPNLQKMGLKIIRLKTGTPQRIRKDSIDYSLLEPQYGTPRNLKFSFTDSTSLPIEEKIVCHLTYTNEKTHQIIRDHLEESAMYGGVVTGVGPRYCPSIEDKVVRFADKPRHQLFIEPESMHNDLVYLQGFSTSMPEYVQDMMVHSLKGLENAKIVKYAYAIEYDAIDTSEYDYTLQIKKWPGLYIGGQICGTSGYEEAGALGLMASINACLKIMGKEPLILRRDQAYIGVMIDDLVSKGTKEPYRLLSSRAEYRLLMRSDNADLRLTPIGHEVGLISEDRYSTFENKVKKLEECKEIMNKVHMGMKPDFVEYMHSLGFKEYVGGPTASEILKRPGVTLNKFKEYLPMLPILNLEEEEQLEIMVKYEGYITKEKREANQLLKLEQVKIPVDIDYLNTEGLRLEARQKLDKVRPLTIGQASRISGVNPADVSALLMAIKKGGN
ncbi:MAG: tRNA uridine-5-carboxymethylaminomethyl(34) synthesis enzyme MnmG [Erysipelotrichaceae bacterium]|nr:tRNA uridine-5-carboxymethylaminomethyl(34) synthesis enzyme MnmG [Erysipelotrichaceae bacterium]